MKEQHKEKLASFGRELTELQGKHAYILDELSTSNQKLEGASIENEKLRSELSEAQSSMDNSYQVCLLQEKFDLMRDESNQKDKCIKLLTDERTMLQDHLNKVDILQADVTNKESEIEHLSVKLEGIEKRNAELVVALGQKEDDVARLVAELELTKQGHIQKSKGKDGELQKLQSALQTAKAAETTLAKTETLMRQYGLININESLSESCGTIEKRLISLFRRDEPNEMLLDVDDGINGGTLQESRHSGKRKRSVNLTPKIDKYVSPRCSTREYKSTKMIYRKESIRRSISCSPTKPSNRPGSRSKEIDKGTPRIKPFSQVQGGFVSQQSSPSLVRHFDNGLSAPTEDILKAISLPVPTTPQLQTAGNGIMSLELPRGPVKDPRVESHLMERERTVGTVCQAQNDLVCQSENSVKSNQTKPEMTPLKGILKETTTPVVLSNENRKVHQTPPTGDVLRKNGAKQPRAPRRQSRTSSQYFNVTNTTGSVSSSSSRQTWAVTQSTNTTATGYSRPRRYGKRKGWLEANSHLSSADLA